MNIKDIARLSGVSISTVSRVINNSAPVNPEVRSRVEAIVEETGYRPNSLAKELQRNETHVIGILLSVGTLELSSIGPTINAISDALQEKGYQIMLANSRFSLEEEIFTFKLFQEKRVDGILYFASEFSDQHYDFLRKYAIPIVMIGQENRKLGFPCVLHDDYHAAYDATRFLIRHGHRRIGYIGIPQSDAAAGEARRRGFDAALKSSKLEQPDAFYALGDFSIESGYVAARQLVTGAPERPTALFVATDFMAIGAIRYLIENGYRVPKDISVIGFDDISVAAYMNPPITTIHTNQQAIGLKAVEMLMTMIGKQMLVTRKHIEPYKIIERSSVSSITPIVTEAQL